MGNENQKSNEKKTDCKYLNACISRESILIDI